MTARELRQLLTAVENQELTAKELRKILFDLEEQDEELTEAKIIQITR